MKIIKSLLIIFIATVVLFQNTAVLAQEPWKCKPTDGYFAANNFVVWSECCDQSAAPASSGTAPAPIASGDGGGCGIAKNGEKANQDQVWSYFNKKFTEAGYTKNEAETATSGIMGNWQQESAFNPARTDGEGCRDHPEHGPGKKYPYLNAKGIAQWCGGRIGAMEAYAQGKSKDWTCLGTQLEFTWQEIQERDLVAKMKGLTPAQASHTFDKIFEVSEGSGEREKKGEAMYREYTGKDPVTLDSSGGNAAAGAENSSEKPEECNKDNPSQMTEPGTTIPDLECEGENGLLKKMKDLVASQKIKIPQERADNDLKKCATEVSCGTNPDESINTAGGGVSPQLLRALISIEASTTPGPLVLWNMNSGHPCDTGDHPVGYATDISCNYGPSTSGTDHGRCKGIIDHLINNKDKLGVRWVIWQQGHRCNSDGFVDCDTGGHHDHIHLSLRRQ